MRLLTIGFAALIGTGCVASSADDSAIGASGPSSCTGAADACKIEGSDIGREGVTIRLDHGTATFVDWIPKAGAPNEFVGFSIVLEGATQELHFAVKSGTELHYGSGDFWRHTGADCQGISHVDLGEGVIDDDPTTGGGGCDNPDGCDDGGGDGGGSGPIL